MKPRSQQFRYKIYIKYEEIQLIISQLYFTFIFLITDFFLIFLSCNFFSRIVIIKERESTYDFNPTYFLYNVIIRFLVKRPFLDKTYKQKKNKLRYSCIEILANLNKQMPLHKVIIKTSKTFNLTNKTVPDFL